MAALLASSLPSIASSRPNPNPTRTLRPKAHISFLFAHYNRPFSAVPDDRRSRPKPSSNRPPNAQSPDRDDPPRIADEWGESAEPEPAAPAAADPPKDEDEWGRERGRTYAGVADEWGEKAEPELEAPSQADPPKNDDEWGRESAAGYLGGNGTPAPVTDGKLGDLKRCLVDSLYGTNFGLRATLEERAEILELINQLEAENPNTAPTEKPELLDGEWILLYTAFSELIPLVAVGQLPLLKVRKISQSIYTQSRTIVNATTISSPFATFSFSATASFDVQSPTRIQVQFKEGAFQPPEISSTLDLPERIDIFGQNIDLKPVQQTLNPIQEAVANITRAISGQPPLKVPIPGERSKSWLLTTYLDEDFRISRGDGGLFVLAKEGSPLLDQLL